MTQFYLSSEVDADGLVIRRNQLMVCLPCEGGTISRERADQDNKTQRVCEPCDAGTFLGF